MNFCPASRIVIQSEIESVLQRLYTVDYPVTFGCDYWFCIYNNNDEIMAECSVFHKTGTCLNNYRQYYYIADVYVPDRFRGNGYAVALILNVIYYFDQNGIEGPFELCAYTSNYSAQRCYDKIFGKPYCKKNNLIYYMI